MSPDASCNSICDASSRADHAPGNARLLFYSVCGSMNRSPSMRATCRCLPAKGKVIVRAGKGGDSREVPIVDRVKEGTGYLAGTDSCLGRPGSPARPGTGPQQLRGCSRCRSSPGSPRGTRRRQPDDTGIPVNAATTALLSRYPESGPCGPGPGKHASHRHP
jgi:hypothetical protein